MSLNLLGHSVIKHMHYDSSGSDRTVCEIVSKVAKTTTIGIMDTLWLLNGRFTTSAKTI